ncbi:hypothetical protein LY76DRAFT_669674, partial [Colletotrichum caudatum]
MLTAVMSGALAPTKAHTAYSISPVYYWPRSAATRFIMIRPQKHSCKSSVNAWIPDNGCHDIAPIAYLPSGGAGASVDWVLPHCTNFCIPPIGDKLKYWFQKLMLLHPKVLFLLILGLTDAASSRAFLWNRYISMILLTPPPSHGCSLLAMILDAKRCYPREQIVNSSMDSTVAQLLFLRAISAFDDDLVLHAVCPQKRGEGQSRDTTPEEDYMAQTLKHERPRVSPHHLVQKDELHRLINGLVDVGFHISNLRSDDFLFFRTVTKRGDCCFYECLDRHFAVFNRFF